MSTATTGRNFSLALLLSITLTFVVAIAYALYPFVSAITSGLLSNRGGTGTGGIGAVAGGVSESFLLIVLLAEPILFFIVFVYLERRRTRSRS